MCPEQTALDAMILIFCKNKETKTELSGEAGACARGLGGLGEMRIRITCKTTWAVFLCPDLTPVLAFFGCGKYK